MDILAKNRFTGDEEFELGQVMDIPVEEISVQDKQKNEIEAIDFSSIKALSRVIKVSATSYKIVPLKTNSHKMIARKLIQANDVAINYTEDLADDNELVNKAENALWNVTTNNGAIYLQRS